MESLSCSICGKFMSAFNNYVRHLRRNHGDIGAQTASALVKETKEARMALKQYQCDLCNFRGSSKDAVRMHKARNHRQALAPLTNLNADATSQKQGLACPQCLANTRDTRSLIEHARLEHEFQGDIVWKEMHERLTVTSWSCYATLPKNGSKTKYYKCFRPRRRNAVEATETSGHPRAIQSACTAFLKTVEYEAAETIEVEYCDKHFGHTTSGALLPLSIGEKSVSCSRKKNPSLVS
ncbi:zinc finger, C2H2 type [Cooperia oncophora]